MNLHVSSNMDGLLTEMLLDSQEGLWFFGSIYLLSWLDQEMFQHLDKPSHHTVLPTPTEQSFFSQPIGCSGVPRGDLGCSTPPQNSEGPSKWCQTQPYCENC